MTIISPPLGKRAMQVLFILEKNKNRVVFRNELVDGVYGGFAGKGAINVQILNIRKVLGEESVITVRGIGYKIGIYDRSILKEYLSEYE